MGDKAKWDLDEEEECDWGAQDPGACPRPATNLQGNALIKEVCRLIRSARCHWDAHHNAAARLVRRRALGLYDLLTPTQREEVPQVLRVWLRYRSEKYYGARKKRKRKRPAKES